MKAKFLICFLLSQMVVAHASYGTDRPQTLKSYFEKLKSIVAGTKPGKLVHTYPTGPVCGGYANLGVTATLLWSDNNAWTSFGTTKPVAGSAVTIPEGVHIILDETPPDLASLNISGKLAFANKNLSLTAGWIMVMGTLEVGTAATPFTHKATITLNATNQNETIMGMGTRGIMVMGGKLELHGVPPTKHYTKLNDHAAAGATTLSLLDAGSWKVNDQVVVATTDFYGAANGSAQRTNITGTNGSSLTIQDGLNAQRWGKLQYLTATGMSLTPGTLPANLSPGTPTVLDERAEVANLTRNIVVQSVDDALWQSNGFGCHIMIMRMNGMVGEAHLNGVEIRRGGQAGKLGRYPFHWHMLSYEGSTTLPDVTGQYIRNSTVNQSAQRGIVIHGTNGAEVKDNVVYDVRGHGIFTEDASERRNTIDGNLVLKIRDPLPANALKKHETNDRHSSGFWISNPDNVLINNTAADCGGNGFWLAFPRRCFGASAGIAMRPNRTKFGTFKNNHAHSNGQEGLFLDHPENDEEGNTFPDRYGSTTDGQEEQWPWNTVLTFELADYTTWKNNRNGIWNRSTAPMNRRAINADNSDRFFSGSIDNKGSAVPAFIEKSLVVGTSLNYNMNGVKSPTQYGSGPLSAFASYHSSVDITNNVVVNFPADPGKPSGYIALNDYYLSPVDKGNVRNTGNILINTHPGVRTKPPMDQHVYGAIWDNHNYLGVEASQDNYYVFDEPFFTYGQTRQIVSPSADVSGGVVIRGPFYGFAGYYVNGIERVYEKIAVTRTNAAGAAVGTVVVEAGARGDILGNMRHFATHPTGYYYLDFPTIDNVNDFVMTATNMLTTDDYQVVSVEYSGDYTISQLFASRAYDMQEYGGTKPFPSGQNHVRAYTPVADFQAVVNAPTGEVYWQDKANNKVWFKVRGGYYAGDPALPAIHDINLYKSFRIRAYGTYTSPSPAYTVAFNIKDAGGTPLPGASVVFNGQTAVSDAGGTVTFTNVAPGSNIPYSASKDGYNNTSGTVSVAANGAQNVILTAVGSPAYTVTFTVKDVGGVLLEGVSVVFNGQTVASNAGGIATFTNVAPGGNQSYGASNTGFNNASGTVSVVSANVSHNIVLSAIGSPAYTVTFIVRDASNAPVAGASVVFNGQTMTTTATGEVVFTNVAPGTGLPYSISKTDFTPVSGSLSVAASNVSQNAVLTPAGIGPNPEPPLIAQLNPRNIFSPNGDGTNERWEVVGIEQQPELRVLIFNVYGQTVFQAQPYNNSWDGAGLPEGVYYYQLQNPQGKSVKKGSLTLVR